MSKQLLKQELTGKSKEALEESVVHIVLHLVELINHILMLRRFPFQSVQHPIKHDVEIFDQVCWRN
jgi:hypothetical protein